MENYKLFNQLLRCMQTTEKEYVWAQSAAFAVASRFNNVEICKVIARKLRNKYPYFVTKLADNYGYDVESFCS